LRSVSPGRMDGPSSSSAGPALRSRLGHQDLRIQWSKLTRTDLTLNPASSNAMALPAQCRLRGASGRNH
jgi:hypothetical protein